jgi:hypothetical protein
MASSASQTPSTQETEHIEREREFELIAYSIMRTLCDIAERPLPISVPGDKSLEKDDPINRINHFKLALLGYSDLLRQRSIRFPHIGRMSDDDMQAYDDIVYTIEHDLFSPIVSHAYTCGKHAVPDRELGRYLIIKYGQFPFDGKDFLHYPYFFQIIRNWFLPSVTVVTGYDGSSSIVPVRYDRVEITFMNGVIRDILVRIWENLLEGNGGGDQRTRSSGLRPSLTHMKTFEAICDNLASIKSFRYDAFIGGAIKDEGEFANVCYVMNEIKTCVARAAISYIQQFTVCIGLSPYIDVIRKTIEYLEYVANPSDEFVAKVFMEHDPEGKILKRIVKDTI